MILQNKQFNKVKIVNKVSNKPYDKNDIQEDCFCTPFWEFKNCLWKDFFGEWYNAETVQKCSNSSIQNL